MSEKQTNTVTSGKRHIIKTIEQPIETEILIPEYCPDIVKVLCCSITPRLLTKSTIGNALTAEGYADISVMFSGENGVISSAFTKYNFSKTVDIDESLSSIQIYLRQGKCSARETSPRRIEIRGSVIIEISGLNIETKTVLLDVDDTDLEMLRKTVPATTDISLNEKILNIDEELYLSQGMPEIKYILRYDAVPTVNECKIISEKAVVKGTLNINVLYCSNEDRPVCFKDSIQYSQILDIDSNGEECSADAKADICSIDLRPITNTDGMTTTITVNAMINLSVSTYCESEIPIILDAYSTTNDSNVVLDNLYTRKRIDTVSERLMLKKQFNFDNDQLLSVIDMWPIINNYDVKFESGEMIVSGDINVNVLAETDSGTVQFFEKQFDFEYKRKINSEVATLSSETSLYVVDASYTVLSGGSKLDVQVEIFVLSNIYENNNISFVVDLELLDKKTKSDDAIVVYFSDVGENLWDISKRFSASLSNVKNENNLTEDEIKTSTMLIIPTV